MTRPCLFPSCFTCTDDREVTREPGSCRSQLWGRRGVRLGRSETSAEQGEELADRAQCSSDDSFLCTVPPPRHSYNGSHHYYTCASRLDVPEPPPAYTTVLVENLGLCQSALRDRIHRHSSSISSLQSATRRADITPLRGHILPHGRRSFISIRAVW